MVCCRRREGTKAVPMLAHARNQKPSQDTVKDSAEVTSVCSQQVPAAVACTWKELPSSGIAEFAMKLPSVCTESLPAQPALIDSSTTLPPSCNQQIPIETDLNPAPAQPPRHVPTCKDLLLDEADLVAHSSHNPKVYQLRLQETLRDESKLVRKLEFGSSTGKEIKVMMVLGATGAGKTTTLNGFMNYIAGVQWEDPFRFRLICETDTDSNQANSQTSWVTAYVVHWREGFQVPFSIVIIDTPGYGDTRGIDRDRAITDQIRHFFGSDSSDGLVQTIDAIGFVAQASLARLTPTQQFIFDSILSLFGKDIEENIAVLATFADATAPPVIAALKEGNVPYCKLLKFNNSALFVSNETECMECNPNEDVEEESMEQIVGFNKMFWDMGARSFKVMASILQKMPSKDLALTKSVLSEREQIEVGVEGISVQVQRGISMCETIRQEIDVMKRHARDIAANRDFTYTVTEDRMVEEPVPAGTYVTNCIKCNFTCHKSCIYANDEDKKKCSAMSRLTGKCNACPGHCHWSHHRNMGFRMKIISEKVQKTCSELKAKYETASKQKLSHAELVSALVEDFERIQVQVLLNTNQVRLGLKRLSEIALRDDPLSHVDYIDVLIQSEKQSGRPGWQARLEQLGEIRKQAVHMQNISNEGFDPFQSYKQGMKPETPEEQSLLQGLKQNVANFFKWQ